MPVLLGMLEKGVECLCCDLGGLRHPPYQVFLLEQCVMVVWLAHVVTLAQIWSSIKIEKEVWDITPFH